MIKQSSRLTNKLNEIELFLAIILLRVTIYLSRFKTQLQVVDVDVRMRRYRKIRYVYRPKYLVSSRCTISVHETPCYMRKKREEKEENEERGVHAWEMNGTAISGAVCSRSRTRTWRRECFTFDERGRRFEYSKFEHCALRIESSCHSSTYWRSISRRYRIRYRGDHSPRREPILFIEISTRIRYKKIGQTAASVVLNLGFNGHAKRSS